MLVWRWRLALEVSDESEGFSGYRGTFFFFFITLGLELSDTKVYEP